MGEDELRIAILVPCLNEEATIERVVRDFRAALPEASVYVYDNNSRDQTAELAHRAGALVRREPLPGKGNVVRRMFSDVDADVYVLVDGDATYHAASAPNMIERLTAEGLDMVVGCRVDQAAQQMSKAETSARNWRTAPAQRFAEMPGRSHGLSPTGDHATAAYRPGHRFGNAMLTGFVSYLFGKRFSDILSGYRVFSRRFVKSFPALSKGFEIETELSVHALELKMPVAEVDTPYGARPEGSHSKLNTYRDGFRILFLIFALFKNERPFQFFSIVAAALAFLSVGLAIPIVIEWMKTGLVPRFPTAILSTGLMILAFLSLTSGLVLETVTRGRQEMKRLVYLSVSRTFHSSTPVFQSKENSSRTL